MVYYKFFIKLFILLSLNQFSIAYSNEYSVNLIQLEPWTFEDTDTSGRRIYRGILVDLLDEFEKRSKHKTKKTLTPYVRMESNLKQGNIDFTFLVWSNDLVNYANKGTVLLRFQFGVRAQKGTAIKNYNDLKKIVISVTRGIKIDPKFDNDISLKKNFVADYTRGVLKTSADRDSKAVAGALGAINYIIKKNKLEHRFEDTFILRNVYLSVCFSKKSPNMKDEKMVNKVFQEMVNDGTVDKIYHKWIE